MTTLTVIANEEGTDKGTIGPVDDWSAHNYTDVYEAYFFPLRRMPITLLEVGLGVDGPNWHAEIAQGRNAQGGGSMRMWYRYFPDARIFGIDVNPAAFLDNDRIRTGVVDQSDPSQLRTFLSNHGIDRVDVVIDDGSHRPDHQQISFASLFPYVAPGGLYFIEDLLDNGKGDNAAGPQANPDVLSTRRVLRAFADEGTFPQPNALDNEADLRDSIDEISFHCPTIVIEGAVGVRRAIRRGWSFRRGAFRTRFQAGQEKLCVVRKKS